MVGSGDPVRRVRHYFPTAEAATAAQAELDKRKRGFNKFTCSMPGRGDLVAEGTLIVQGFGSDDVDGEWLITRVEHTVNQAGYSCSVEAEKPTGTNDDADPNDTESADDAEAEDS